MIKKNFSNNVYVSKVELFRMTGKDKPPGVDELDRRLLKPTASVISPLVTHIINQCFNTNKFLSAWKITKVIPLFKKKTHCAKMHNQLSWLWVKDRGFYALTVKTVKATI